MSNIDENMIPSNTLPSGVSDENREDPMRVDLTQSRDIERTKDDDGRKELKKRGRPTSSMWDHFTDAVQPQNSKSNMCKHCKT